MDSNHEFSHLSEDGKPKMVNIGEKTSTERRAVAEALMSVGKAVYEQFHNGDVHTKKGSVFHTAVIAGTMAVKKTADLIPFCHPLPVSSCEFFIDFEKHENNSGDVPRLIIRADVRTHAPTGVEMEALNGVSIAALTVYDMCKSLGKNMEILQTRLLLKEGGKQNFRHPDFIEEGF